jgi:hypothetical protein
MSRRQSNSSSDSDYQNLELPLFDSGLPPPDIETLPNPEFFQAEAIETEAFRDEVRSAERTKDSRTPQQLAKDFEKLFDSLTYSRDRREVFRDWAELAAVWQTTAVYDLKAVLGVDFCSKDKLYDQMVHLGEQVIKRYKSGEVEKFGEMTTIVVYGSGLGGSDFLGELYNKLDLTGNSQRQVMGEFFTPYSLGRMIARMSMEESTIKSAIDEKGYVSFEEPACGAGCLLIAAAERMEELGYSPKQHMLFVARDINRLCFNMTYLQMSALGIPGVVSHGNTLTLQMHENRPTPMMLMDVKKIRDEVTKEYKEHLLLKYRISLMDDLLCSMESKPEKRVKPEGFGKPLGTQNKPKRKEKPQQSIKKKQTDVSNIQLDLFDIRLETPQDFI